MKKFIAITAIFLSSAFAVNAQKTAKDTSGLLMPECQDWWTQNCTTMSKETYERMQAKAKAAHAELDREIAKMEARDQAMRQAEDGKRFYQMHFNREQNAFLNYQQKHDEEHRQMFLMLEQMNQKLDTLNSF